MKKYFTCCLIILIFSSLKAAEYKVPKKPASIATADINLDGYIDIILGHDTDSETGWSGISVLLNDGKGNFTLSDTVSLFANQQSIHVKNIDADPHPEIIALAHRHSNYSIVVIKNSSLDSIILFPLHRTDNIDGIEIGKINQDEFIDVVLWSNQGKFWGILFGDGKGGFLSPEYFDLDWYPVHLSIGDLYGDNRDDIAVTSNKKFIQLFFYHASEFDTQSIDTSPLMLKGVIADIDSDDNNEILGFDGTFIGLPKRFIIFKKNENNKFAPVNTSQWIDEAIGHVCINDINNDSYPDLIFNSGLYYPNSRYETFHTYVMINNQDYTFQNSNSYFTGICSKYSLSADLNADGWKDIVTLNYDFFNPPPDTCSIHILFNDGTGKFIEDTVRNKFWLYSGEIGADAVYSFVLNSNQEMLAGTGSGIFVSPDNGITWNHRSGGLPILCLTSGANGNLYAGTNGAGIYKSSDNGDTWITSDSSFNWVNALTVNKNGDIIAGCALQGIYVSTNEGIKWTRRNNGLSDSSVYSLAVNNSGDIFAGTSSGVFRSTNNGFEWIKTNLGLSDSAVLSIMIKKDGKIFCGTESGLYISVNNGNNWNKTTLPKNEVKFIVVSNNEDLYVATYRGGVYESSDDGITWKQVNGGFFYPSILSLTISSEGHLVAGAMGGFVYRSVNPVTSVDNIEIFTPSKFSLFQNYPNPFNSGTFIKYQIAGSSRVTLKVYDVLGREIATVVDENQDRGFRNIYFDSGNLSSGVYFYKLQSGASISTKKMLLIR